MSMVTDIATDVVSEALIVNEAAKTANSSHTAHAHEHGGNCANCGTLLTGPYCHACGQSAHIHRSLLHMTEEFLHGFLHFETKAWRTIPALIFKPGQLTRNYIQGQRTRYVSPLALFLFLIFLMFFVFSMTANHPEDKLSSATKNKVSINNNNANAIGGSKEKIQQVDDSSVPSGIDKELSETARTSQKTDNEKNQKNNPAAAAQPAAIATETDNAATDNEIVDAGVLIKKIDQQFDNRKITSTIPRLEQKIRSAVKNPELILYKMKSNASKFAFLLMPMSLPFLWLLFIFRRQYVMFDHAVFSLYSLCFMSLLLMCIALLNRFGFSITAAMLFAFVPPVHMYTQLKQAYQLSVKGALWRTFALLFIATCALTFYAIVVLSISV
ncbi:DUF3667 domain-containing protein [Undibacterium sp. FT147W]|uniref:DUF3667 domain-containing protein n=1 Tax=Undibacterium rivi TaxID=2828729 RepID=A0ABS5H4K6_9BURK|nr:DUF3667 domain-containing protein [Undibacterium rivi]MBR7793044.1 DUF3667 domain-containing protein [Undibacterium rivi]